MWNFKIDGPLKVKQLVTTKANGDYTTNWYSFVYNRAFANLPFVGPYTRPNIQDSGFRNYIALHYPALLCNTLHYSVEKTSDTQQNPVPTGLTKLEYIVYLSSL